MEYDKAGKVSRHRSPLLYEHDPHFARLRYLAFYRKGWPDFKLRFWTLARGQKERLTALTYNLNSSLRVGDVRYGYDLADDGLTLVANDDDQQGLALMQALHEGGWSLRRIAAELDKHGFPTKYGKPWSAKVVSTILKRNA